MKQAPLQTEEELRYVKEFIIYPVVLDVLERDIKTLDCLQLKMPEIYIRSLQRVQEQVIIDLTAVRKKLNVSGMKVYEESRTKKAIEASYLCRGYHHTFAMLWGNVRAEIQMKLSHYMGIDLTGEATKNKGENFK